MPILRLNFLTTVRNMNWTNAKHDICESFLLLDVDESDVEEAIETFKPISMLSVTNDVFHFCSTP